MLALVVVLGACVSKQSWEATRVLQDIDVGSGASTLKETTPQPRRSTVTYTIDGRLSVADIYEPLQPIGAGLVLVPGFTPDGKDDARLVDLAMSLARSRFLVLVPDLAGSRAVEIRPDDARSIADGVVYLAGSDPLPEGHDVGVAAISYAVGLAVMASMEPDAGDKIDFLVGLGGYHDTEAVITFATTGRYREGSGETWQFADPVPAAKWLLLASNTDLLENAEDRALLQAIAERRSRSENVPIDDLVAGLGPEGQALLDVMINDDPAAVDDLLQRLPPAITDQLEALSPAAYDLSHLEGRLILIHGRDDTLIPYTQSIALGNAVAGSEVFVIDGFSHIDRSGMGLDGKLQLITALQAVLDRRL